MYAYDKMCAQNSFWNTEMQKQFCSIQQRLIH